MDERKPGLGEPEAEGAERDDPRVRAEWFLASRRDEEGRILHGILAKAIRRRRELQRELNARGGRLDGEPEGTPGPAGSVNWTPIGPSVVAAGSGQRAGVSGRVNGLAIGPGGARVYAGAANGGIWLSPDGGATWSPLDDYAASPSPFGGAEEDSLSVGAVGVRFGASAASDDVYVGTGEPSGNYDAYFGIGIRHSPNGGAPGTWALEATNLTGRGVYAIAIDPDDPSVVLAATTAGIFRRPAAAPFTAWTQVTGAFASPASPATALVVAGSGTSKRWYAAFPSGGVYQSQDGATWTALPGLAGSGRIALDIAESDPTIVYAFRADGTLARLVSGSFATVAGMPREAVFRGNQGWYDIAILVDPGNPDTIFLGGDRASVFKGTISSVGGTLTFPFNAANAGNPWADPTFVGQYVHSDVHALAFALNAAGTGRDGTSVWVGSDGGVFHSSASGEASTFGPRNTGLAITETAYLGQRADTDAVVFVGSQDNGTSRLLGEAASVEVVGGDGGGTAIDQDDPYRVMRQYVRASLDRSLDGGGSWSGIHFPPTTSTAAEQTNAASTENGRTGFVAPIASSPAGLSPSLVAFGTDRLWLSEDWGGTWVTLPAGTNPYATAVPNEAQDVLDGSAVRAIAFASATRLYAATLGTIWRYDKAGASWSRTVLPATGLPAYHPITALAVADAAAGTLYATLGGGGIAHVWFFDGTSWHAAMPTSVVDVPAHAVATDPAHPDTVYVGTDVGCWKGTQTGATSWSWTVFSQGLPEAAIVDFALHARARLLRASTHGRGVWEIELDATSGRDPDLYLRVNDADSGRTPGGARFAWVEGAPDQLRQGATVYHWMSTDVKVRRPSLGSLPPLGSPPDYLDYAVNIGDYVDSVSDIETADSSGPNRIFVELHNRSLTPVPAAQVRVCLLVTDASAALPPLPGEYARHLNEGDASPGWLAGSGWRFADPVQPYRTPPRDLDVRTPQVVEFTVDFASLSLPLGHDHVCAAAFLTTTTTADQIGSTESSLDQVTMHDKHVAHRNLHLVAAGATPITPSDGGGRFRHEPQTFLVQFHDAGRKQPGHPEIVVDCGDFPGEVSVMLPAQVLDRAKPSGFELVERRSAPAWLREQAGQALEWLGEELEELGRQLERGDGEWPRARLDRAWGRTERRLRTLDWDRHLVLAKGGVGVLAGVPIEPKAPLTAALTIQAPPGAEPGDRFRIDVIQRRGETIVGGSSYVVAVCERKREDRLGGLLHAVRAGAGRSEAVEQTG